MSKLQQIERVNGSVVSSINIPKEELEKLDWKKGEELEVHADIKTNPITLVIRKK